MKNVRSKPGPSILTQLFRVPKLILIQSGHLLMLMFRIHTVSSLAKSKPVDFLTLFNPSFAEVFLDLKNQLSIWPVGSNMLIGTMARSAKLVESSVMIFIQ